MVNVGLFEVEVMNSGVVYLKALMAMLDLVRSISGNATTGQIIPGIFYLSMILLANYNPTRVSFDLFKAGA